MTGSILSFWMVALPTLAITFIVGYVVGRTRRWGR